MVGSYSVGGNSIFYHAGFKSYNITKCQAGAETWYDLVECSRNLIRRVKVSLKVFKWLVSVFIEASKEQDKVIRRCRMKDHIPEFFYTLKYNENEK